MMVVAKLAETTTMVNETWRPNQILSSDRLRDCLLSPYFSSFKITSNRILSRLLNYLESSNVLTKFTNRFKSVNSRILQFTKMNSTAIEIKII